jgi:hypothetical protein
MRSFLDAGVSGTIDMEPIRVAAQGLPDADRRYQLSAAAFSQVWLDVEAHRPWRRGFAASIRGLGPFPVPAYVHAFIAVQELSAPIAVVLATVIMAAIVAR